MTNKQRITQITKREKQAAITGGALDTRIPKEAIQSRLKNDPRDYDLDAILDYLEREIGWMRLIKSADPIKPSEVEKQAQQTIAVIDELLNRFENLHPDLSGRIEEMLFQTRGEFVHQVTERIAPDLYLLRAVLNQSARDLANEPTRTGPKSGWPSWRNRIAELLRDHSRPKISIKQSEDVAAELLELCGLPKSGK